MVQQPAAPAKVAGQERQQELGEGAGRPGFRREGKCVLKGPPKSALQYTGICAKYAENMRVFQNRAIFGHIQVT